MENSGVAPPLHLFAFHLKGSLSPQGSGMVMIGGVSPTQVKFKPDDLDSNMVTVMVEHFLGHK